MRILIAEDNETSCRLLHAFLTKWGYEVEVARDGHEAWAAIQRPHAPHLAILDWMMPGLDGVDVCRRTRALASARSTHLILLTAKGRKEDIVTGLEAGADDYLIKPFDSEELRARLAVAVRILGLQDALSDRVQELETALANVHQLQGLLPICCYCKKIRDDKNYWQQVEVYIAARSHAEFSHGICPDCFENVVKPELDQIQARDLAAAAR
jgi:CheY-like chemotaxis protein